MTPDKLKAIIAQKEGTEIEFKKSQTSLAKSVKRGLTRIRQQMRCSMPHVLF
jgi:hypothetical protein